MKFGQILVYLTLNISNMFLVQYWRLEIMITIMNEDYDFNEMTI